MDQLQEAGTALSRRLDEFEQRFASLPFKCEHKVLSPITPRPGVSARGVNARGVGFRKDGSAWKLYLVEIGSNAEERSIPVHGRDPFIGSPTTRLEDVPFETWSPLSGASLLKKSEAAALLGRLYSEMSAEYERRMKSIRRAMDVLDDLEATWPSKGGA